VLPTMQWHHVDMGQYKTWAMDCGLEHGLDHGLNSGLNNGLLH